jgi:hypothetical protein
MDCSEYEHFPIGGSSHEQRRYQDLRNLPVRLLNHL